MNESYVTVVGNVVSDPISRPTTHGRPWTSLRVASTTRRWDPDQRTFVDGNTNFVNVSAFNALAANVMTSIRKGQPVVVYGRLRVSQWETDKGEQRSSVEVDAYTIGHDLSRGQTAFTKASRAQHDTTDRPADAGNGGPNDSVGSWPAAGAVGEAGTDVAPPASVVVPGGFGRAVEDADTDDYVVVGG